MEENNREEREERKKGGFGFFYGVIGVATLVIAIIGATFAYFTATTSNDDTIKGETATAGLSLNITHLSTGAAAGLIPLNTTDLQKAVTGDTAATGSPKYCLDKDNNSVCQIYSIEVSNEGSAATAVAGTLNLAADTDTDANSAFANLKWELLTDASTVNTSATAYGTGINDITTNTTIAGNGSETWYLVIWVDNIDNPQETIDKGHFLGTVSFNAASGTGVVGTFSS